MIPIMGAGGNDMNKDDILAKSRKENKDKDLYAAEVNTNAATIGSITATVLATVFFVIQHILGDGWNLALYAIVVGIGATTFVTKAIFLKRKLDIVLAVIFSLATLVLSIIHIYGLVAG